MNADYPAQEVPATPEYILAVIKDSYRQQCQYDPEVEKGVLLTFESTIQEWRKACDLLDWRQLAKAMNAWFKTDFLDEQWKAVLEPAKEKKLRGVCELLATKAKRLEIKPFGNACVNAGIFLTVRSLLKRAGSHETIKPSTPIAPFFRNYLERFMNEIGRIEPGALPPVRLHNPFYVYSCWAFLLGLGICGIGSFLSPLITIFGVCFTGLAYTAHWIAAKSRPKKVEFGSIETFGDLTLLIAKTRTQRLFGQGKS
ncbi:MAG: hypothetical protein ABSA83_14190 [Verrucomicrobiota bacterium]|jgi:hypothetical protein